MVGIGFRPWGKTMSALLAPIERSVQRARRRLFLHLLVNRLAWGWALGLAVSLGWLLAEPWLVASAEPWWRWAVLGGSLAIATVVAGILAWRGTPSKAIAALELDSRFGLRERVTTALDLPAEIHSTPAGQAVIEDAVARVTPLAVKTQFPVRLGWSSAAVPVLAASIAAVVVFYHPDTTRTADGSEGTGNKNTVPATTPNADAKKSTPFTKKNQPPELANRPKDDKLKALENELNEMMRKFDTDPNRETQEKLREKVAELSSAEDKLKKFQQEKFEKLNRLEQQLQQLDRLNKDPDFQDGPVKNLQENLSKGDLKKAQEDIDELKKKVKDKKLTKEDQEKLSKQLEKMKDQIQQLNRNKEREKQLKDLIDQAKKEGRDAESLERELDKLKQETKEGQEASQQLAEKLSKAQQALKNDDLEKAAEELGQAGKSLEQIEGELQDLEEAQDYLQRLKAEKKGACKQCQGQGDEDSGRKDDATGAGRASGNRPENKDAKTSGEDERIRGLFDPRGKKTYGGSTRGPAFKKATTEQLGPAIQEAAQAAPKATDSQRLPRDAKDSVKEYFQNLGGQAPGGSK